MLKRRIPCILTLILIPLCGRAQSDPDLQKILQRLDRLEQDNQKLRQELREVRQALADSSAEPVNERLDVQEKRTEELAQTKVETSQRMPVSLTGMLLFNAFHNGPLSGTSQNPVVAGLHSGPISAGASLRQTVLGLKFSGPDLPGGGKASGSLYMDFFAGSREPDDHLLRIRTATVDLAWKNTTLTFGQDKPIFAPREPDSLAQVGVSPLTGAGNLWDWQPQVRIEQRFHFGENFGLRAQAGIYQTSEGDAFTPAALARTLEHARPGYEGRFQFWSGGEDRRIEIAPGFHISDTHVAGRSVPSRLVSLDWLVRPVKAVEVTGAWFRGENVANLGALRQGFTVLGPSSVIPIHSLGGWAQVAYYITPKLTFHMYGGQERDRASDLNGSGVSRNFIYAGNFMYRLGPNVLASFEASQSRTLYVVNGLRLNNHYDLALAYLF